MIKALTIWAARWNIPAEAIGELAIVSGYVNGGIVSGGAATSEAATQSQCRLDAPTLDAHLWRNNNGALKDVDGRMVRFGLGNDSKRINDKRKSSDLIGITQVTVTAHHVGRTFGVFTAIEIKRPTWTAPENDRDRAQYNWIQHINFNGGLASFVNHPHQLKTLIESYRL